MTVRISNRYSDKKIVWFWDKLQSFKNNTIAAPLYVRIKPLNACNHSCFWCVYHHDLATMHENMNAKDKIPKEKFRELLSDLKDIGVKAVTYSGGGEPLMYDGIEEFLQTTLDNGINLSIITHGGFLNKDKAKILGQGSWVRISMDYWDPQSIHETRNVPTKFYDGIMENIANFAKLKNPTCDLSVNYIVTQKNYTHLEEITVKLKDIGVENIRFSPMWADNFHEYHKPITDTVQATLKVLKQLDCDNFKVYSSYNQVYDLNISKRSYKKCYVNQTIPAVGADQYVYTCHNQAYSDDSIIGSIKDKSFKEMWFSQETKHFFDSFDCQSICTDQCAADKKNEFINELLDCEGDNFV